MIFSPVVLGCSVDSLFIEIEKNFSFHYLTPSEQNSIICVRVRQVPFSINFHDTRVIHTYTLIVYLNNLESRDELVLNFKRIQFKSELNDNFYRFFVNLLKQ